MERLGGRSNLEYSLGMVVRGVGSGVTGAEGESVSALSTGARPLATEGEVTLGRSLLYLPVEVEVIFTAARPGNKQLSQ